MILYKSNLILIQLFFFLLFSITLNAKDPKINRNYNPEDHFTHFNQGGSGIKSQEEDSIRGFVKDINNVPLEGATVLVKGTTIGTITDNKGIFSIKSPHANPTLLISYLGFLSKEVVYQGKSFVEVQLVGNEEHLQEVVIIGYGTRERQDITGSISSLTSKEIDELPVTNVEQVLQGRVAGVDVVSAGRSPGAEANVRIRGRRSFSAGNEPLYVVDGIPLSGGFNDININDIESLEVLKDASSTAIYGSRGANGIVLVTTKRGKDGKTDVFYDAYYGVSAPLGQVDVMNGEQFAEFKRESRRATGSYNDNDPDADKKLFDAIEQESIVLGRSTDYQSLILKNGHQHSQKIGVQGGNGSTGYYISGSYFNDVGVVPGQDFNRYTLRLNLDQKIGKKVKIGISSLTSYNITNHGSNPFPLAIANNPLGKPYKEDGSLNFFPSSDRLSSNPLNEIVKGAYVREVKRIRLFNNIFGEYEIAKGLKYRLNFGPDFQFERRNEFSGRLTNLRKEGDPTARAVNGNTFSYTFENLLNYQRVFQEKHEIDFTGLYSIQSRTDELYEMAVRGVPVETQESYNMGSAPIITGISSNYSNWAIVSYMARANYSYRNKYLLTLTTRIDQSSRFSKENRNAVFPSIGVGWNLTQEEFFNNKRVVSYLKVRGSYGKTANTEIDPYQTQGQLFRTTYAFGNTGAYGFRPSAFVNKDLKWETTTSSNIGVDFGFLQDRVTGTIELYRQNTNELLMLKQLPGNTGYSSILENVGETRNSGIEISLSTINLISKNGLKWTTYINWFKNKEEIVSLYGGKEDDIGNNWFIGQPLTVFYDYEKIGIWQLNEESIAASYKMKPGEIKIKDQNNDNVINASDRVVLGTDVPDWVGGITNRLFFKGFDFSFFIYARKGGMIRSLFHDTNNRLSGRNNNLDVDYWTPDNPTNAYPRPNQNQESPVFSSSMAYFDGSFVKVRNITLGFTLGEKAVKALKMKSCRIYGSAQQPFIISSYRSKHNGIDPEFARLPVNGVEQSADLDAITPSSSLFLLGLNIKL